jgi:hypothetical protein
MIEIKNTITKYKIIFHPVPRTRAACNSITAREISSGLCQNQKHFYSPNPNKQQVRTYTVELKDSGMESFTVETIIFAAELLMLYFVI